MKKELRKAILKQRSNLAGDIVNKHSQLIINKVLRHSAYKDSKIIMMYLDFRNEVKTGDLIKQAILDGKRVLVPVTDIPNRKLTPSEIINYPDDLTLGAYDILEPKQDCIRPVDPIEIDLVLVPGVGFSEDGFRLGYGGGFYDRFLLRTNKNCIWMAPIFELQVKNNVYHEDHDCQMHYLVTESREIKCR